MSEIPGMGARGLPALLTTPGALRNQLGAALDAGRASRLRILVPMVTSLREIRLAREALEEAAADKGAEKPDIGVMVEVPSAALIADRLAQEVDFISIGTNDLTQHVLGVSRRDPSARPSLAAHPSLLALINRVVRSGAAHGRTVGVCGEAGGDPLVLPLLVGMGVGALSVSPAMVDEVRSQVRSLSFDSCRAAVRAALVMDSVEEVWALVRERFPREAP
jgi:multiphosphoryl transfer protein